MAETLAPPEMARASTRSLRGQFEMHLDVEPASIGYVRSIVRDHLELWGHQELHRIATVGISELLTNGHQHVEPKIVTIVVQCVPDGICVTVSDLSSRMPVVKNPGLLEDSGRGLHLLSCLVDDWNAVQTPTGKDVWFRLQEAHDSTPPKHVGDSA